MRTRTGSPIRFLLVGLLAASGLLGPAVEPQSADEPAYGDGYGAGTYGRVRYAESGATLIRAEAGQEAGERLEAGVNLAIFPGDSVITGPSGRLEVQLSQGSLIRIDRGSELTFLALPDPYAEFPDHAVLQLAVGTVRLATVQADSQEFRLDTSAASLYPLGDNDLRVEVAPDGRTRVISRRGVAEVVGDDGSILLRAGTRAQVLPGAKPDDPVPFNTLGADDFDLWVDRRERDYREQLRYAEGDRDTYEALPDEVRPYEVELSAHGSWIRTEDYGWVWSPDHVAADWRPYQAGYWDYGPSGYFWVSYEPWGWAPYHYGRWTWVGGHRWCWVPGRVFAGAWVAWSWGPTYVGWSALDCWGSPIHYGPLSYGYYDPHAWVFSGYSRFHHHHGHSEGHHDHHDHFVTVDHVGDSVRHNAIVTRPPKASPRDLSTSAQTRSRALREVQEERNLRDVRSASSRSASRRFDGVEREIASRGARTRPAAPTPSQRTDRVRTISRPASERTERAPAAPRSLGERTRPAQAVPRATTERTERAPLVSRPAGEGTRPLPAAPRASSAVSRAERNSPAASSESPRSLSRPIRSYPRKISPAPRERSAAEAPAAGRNGSTEAPRRVAPRPRVQPSPAESGSRLRDLYERVARPRQTQESPSAGSRRQPVRAKSKQARPQEPPAKACASSGDKAAPPSGGRCAAPRRASGESRSQASSPRRSAAPRDGRGSPQSSRGGRRR